MTAAAFGLIALVWAAPASADHAPFAVHAILERSTPAAADTLSTSPTEVVLVFSGLVEDTGATLRLLGPYGRAWTLEALRADDTRTISAAVPALESGGYRVEWRVISADGHSIAGDFTFFVRASGESSVGDAPPPSMDQPETAGARAAAAGPSLVLVVARSIADLLLLPLAGLLVFSWWSTSPAPVTMSLARALSALAPIAVIVYAWLWTGEALGAGADPAARVRALAALTTGRALLAEAVLAALVPWALLLAQRTGLAAVLGILAVAAGGLGGHPASYTPIISVPANVVHLVAAALWTGGLVFLATERRQAAFAVSAGRVSSVALVSVVAVAATGLLQTWLILGSPRLLFASAFGWLVLAKVAGLAGLVAFGAYHRFRLVPLAATPDGAQRLAGSVRGEIALAAGVVVLAALLSHVPPTP